MVKSITQAGLLFSALLLAGCQTTVPYLSAAEQVESARLAASLPIADLHMHDGIGMSASAETGVTWAGFGSMEGDRSSWLSMKRKYGERFIAWSGQAELYQAFLSGGVAKMLDPNDPEMVRLYQAMEADFKNGVIVGIGEIFINKTSYDLKGQVDAPGMRKLFDLVAKYDGFLALHLESDAKSIAQMGKLLASNRKGRIVWNHCGNNTGASEVRAMLDKHPNLFCEISARFSPITHHTNLYLMFNAHGIDPFWRQLMEDRPDRFMIGTDSESVDAFVDAIRTVRHGLLPYLKPATARKIAYQNAQRLFLLKGNTGS
jgi:predicted TIM-barrel fold metal-dependent hydrolase